MSSVSVSIPNALLKGASTDLVVVHQLNAGGIPADFIRNGSVYLKEGSGGSVTKAVGKTSTVFTYTPPVPIADPKDAQIEELNGKVAAATGLITDLQKRATTAENLNSSLEKQVTASAAQITDLQKRATTAEAQVTASAAQINDLKSKAASAEALLAQATAAKAAPAPETPVEDTTK